MKITTSSLYTAVSILSYSFKKINMAYSDLLSTVYRLSDTVVHDKEFNKEEYSEEEVAETMVETLEQYMSKTRADYGSRIARPKIEDKDSFELKGQFLKELRDNTFSGSDHEDANEHIEKVLEIIDLFHIPNITQDQVILRAFPIHLGNFNSMRREVKKFYEKAYDCSSRMNKCKGPHYTKITTQERHNPQRSFYINLVDLSKEGDIKQRLRDSTRGTMQTLRIKNEDNLWMKP
ncbi:hypothetical protein Tco_0620672 [Tanacetum coccineum]